MLREMLLTDFRQPLAASIYWADSYKPFIMSGFRDIAWSKFCLHNVSSTAVSSVFSSL